MSDCYFWRASGVAAKRNREGYFEQLQAVNNLFLFGHWVRGENKEETRSSLVYSWKNFVSVYLALLTNLPSVLILDHFFSFSLAFYLSKIYKISRTALGTIFRLSWKLTFSKWGELILTLSHTSKPVMFNFFQSYAKKRLLHFFINHTICQHR